MSKGSKNCVSK